MKDIFLIKHAETDENNDLHMSQSQDTPLNDNGKKQAKITGQYFKKFKDLKNLIIISSPILRCKQTAEIIADQLTYDKQNIIYEEKISEIKINPKYKNLTKNDFKSLRDTDISVKNFFKFHDKKSKIKNPIELNEFLINYESKRDNDVYESVESISTRLLDFVQPLKDLPFTNIMIITHGGICRWMNRMLINNVGHSEFSGPLINNKTNCAISYYIYQGDDIYLVSPQSNYHLKDDKL
jgi:broad specificity phosphatase PhoE